MVPTSLPLALEVSLYMDEVTLALISDLCDRKLLGNEVCTVMMAATGVGQFKACWNSTKSLWVQQMAGRLLTSYCHSKFTQLGEKLAHSKLNQVQRVRVTENVHIFSLPGPFSQAQLHFIPCFPSTAVRTGLWSVHHSSSLPFLPPQLFPHAAVLQELLQGGFVTANYLLESDWLCTLYLMHLSL